MPTIDMLWAQRHETYDDSVFMRDTRLSVVHSTSVLSDDQPSRQPDCFRFWACPCSTGRRAMALSPWWSSTTATTRRMSTRLAMARSRALLPPVNGAGFRA